jgi:hypothetical protein
MATRVSSSSSSRDHAELEQVLGLAEAQELPEAVLGLGLDRGAEADGRLVDPLLDDLVQADEGAPTDEQDVRRVDLQELLLGVLAAALGGHVGHRALDELEQGLLHALAADVTGDRGVLRLAADLVDLVDVDDALHRPLDVVLGGLEEAQDDVLDVFTDVAGLGQAGRVTDGEGHVEEAGQGLGQQRLARPGRADEEDVALLELDLVVGVAGVDPLVVVVHGDREDLLGPVLADDVLVEVGLDVLGLGHQGAGGVVVLALVLFGDDLVAQLDALVADVDRGTGDELAHFLLGLAAEGAAELLSVRTASPHVLALQAVQDGPAAPELESRCYSASAR